MLRKIASSLSIYQGLPSDIYFIAFARFLLGLGNFIIPFLVLLLTQKLGYSTTVAGGLAMGVTGIYLFGNLIGGKLADSFGHKRIMVTGELAGAVILIVCGFFSESHLFAPALLFISYFCFGVSFPASSALVADLSTPKNRDAVMSLSYLAYNLGSGIGPVLAGYLFWNHTVWIYWGNGIAAFIGIVVVMLWVKEPKHNIHDVDSDQPELERAAEGSVWQVLRQRPRLIIFTLCCTLLWFALYQMTMTTPLYLSHVFDKHGAVLFGQLMTFASILVVLITPLLMRLTSQQCEIKSLAISGLLFAVGYWVILLNTTIAMQFFAWIFLSAAEVLLVTKEGVYLANHSPQSHRGRISGILTTIRNLALMPTYVFMGAQIQQFGYQSTWAVVIAVSFFAALSLWTLSLQQGKKQEVALA
ncbi:MFS transporter [Photobacterium kasasachensis]|uniref:MFS transporter n=1 Tax=Photobacterium kasasachensis TaxID=2910240 RepID=UPI003D0E4B22